MVGKAKVDPRRKKEAIRAWRKEGCLMDCRRWKDMKKERVTWHFSL